MRVKFLSTDAGIKLVVFLLIVFVTVGDLILPEPLKGASAKTKSALNSFILGIVPDKEFTNPNDRTEKAVEEFEKETGGK
ncbi:MAG: hypothetical protein WBB82_09640 [Limnothrix sp.]